MNLLLLFPENMLSDSKAIISGRQLEHLQSVLKAKVGDTLCVGLLNKQIGRGRIEQLSPSEATLTIEWQTEPPSPLPVTLFIALPRPKMLKRIIQTTTAMGVKKLYFINSWKVEKSYWSSPWLSPKKIMESCTLGLEQARDTCMPEIHLKPLFKPFVEDELPELIKDTQNILAHPGVSSPCPINISAQTSLVVGPEGGFTPYEVGMLETCGFQAVHLGERILRVENAVPVLLARLFCS